MVTVIYIHYDSYYDNIILRMRTFVISDIHGNNLLFRKALKEVSFKKSDKLILLGDLIDRGSDSKGVLDTIILMKNNGLNVEVLMGNHEMMLLDSFININNLNFWLINGGDKTLSSFLTSSIDKIPVKYLELIRSFKFYLEFDGFICVHAALNMKLVNPYSDLKTILTERKPYNLIDKNWLKGRKLIHGHNPTSENDIIQSLECDDEIICIDNGVFLKKEGYGKICILELENLKPIFVS